MLALSIGVLLMVFGSLPFFAGLGGLVADDDRRAALTFVAGGFLCMALGCGLIQWALA